MYGKNAPDFILKVPIGTIAKDLDTGRIVADLTKHGEKTIVARGGRGGRGNAHFASSTHQAPRYAENGEPGEALTLQLELKLLADVGLLGYPNVGKSSLVSVVSAAKPKVADYPFTTLIPNLGVVKVDDDPTHTFVMADIPGLIEGASEGIGLGHQFLRHVERTRLLAHILDVSGLTGRDPLEDYAVLNRELAAYSPKLAALPQVIVLNKIDVAPPELVESVSRHFADLGLQVFKISAATGEGTHPLVYHLASRLAEIPKEPIVEEEDFIRITPGNTPGAFSHRNHRRDWKISRDEEEDEFVVAGASLERLVAMTPMDNEHAVHRLQKIMERNGVYEKLRLLGAKEGNTVRIGGAAFDYIDEDDDE